MDMLNMTEFKRIGDGEKTLLVVRAKFHKANFLFKLISPLMFRQFLTKYYRNIESLAKAEMDANQLKPNYQLLMEQVDAQKSGEEK
jgi:hypothetical protein